MNIIESNITKQDIKNKFINEMLRQLVIQRSGIDCYRFYSELDNGYRIFTDYKQKMGIKEPLYTNPLVKDVFEVSYLGVIEFISEYISIEEVVRDRKLSKLLES